MGDTSVERCYIPGEKEVREGRNRKVRGEGRGWYHVYFMT